MFTDDTNLFISDSNKYRKYFWHIEGRAKKNMNLV